MSKVYLRVDPTELAWVLDKLTGKELVQAQKRTLARAGRLLYKQTQQNASSVPKVRVANPKYSDTMYDGIRMSVQDDGDFRYWVKVHILGNRKKTSGTFRLRFFEGGTVTRKTKKGYNRGKIKPLNFFQSAVDSTKNKVQSTLDSELSKTI